VALIRKVIAKMKGNLIWEFSGKHSPIKITQEKEIIKRNWDVK